MNARHVVSGASLPIRVRNEWWRRYSDGSWERWDEAQRVWEEATLPAPPPPPPSARVPAPASPRTAKQRSPLARWTSTALVVLTVLGWAVFLRPTFLGGSATYVVVAGESMEPVLHTGDLVVARRQDSYRVGDVVAFEVTAAESGGGAIVIHRIVGGSGDEGWVLQGDNKDEPDFWRPTNEEISGKRWLLIPRAGHVLVLLRSPLVFALGASILVFLLVVMPAEAKPQD